MQSEQTPLFPAKVCHTPKPRHLYPFVACLGKMLLATTLYVDEFVKPACCRITLPKPVQLEISGSSEDLQYTSKSLLKPQEKSSLKYINII